MQHRHLNRDRYSLAAIDDVIGRGEWRDWVDLRHAALTEPPIAARIQHLCAAHAADHRAQRYAFWTLYAQRHLAEG